FIGDHVKTGIGTLLNTGIGLGIGANLFGGGMFAQKFIPSFVWGDNQTLQQYHWEKFIQTVQTVMERRKVSLSPAEKELLQRIYEMTLSDRTALKS
ncbi:MAG: glucose-1-phosphate thymidylyltransferase, partial [Thermodesulfobacteriota bacterium]